MKNILILAVLINFFAASLSCAEPQGTAVGEKLFEAVQFQDLPAVQALLAKGAKADYQQNGRPLLGWAAQSGSVEVVEALLRAGANPNTSDSGGTGHTPLMRAIDTQQTAIVKALLKGGANPNAKTPDGKTCLSMGAESRKPEIVQALVDGGADMKAVTPEGDSPALTAAQDGMPESLEILRILGKAGANLNASNAAYTPLVYALEQENTALVTTLLEAGADPNIPTQSGKLPLEAVLDNAELVALLLKFKADPNKHSEHNAVPLIEAIQNGNTDSAKTLIENKADLSVTANDGSTLLQLAERNAQSEIADLLRKHTAPDTGKEVGGYKVYAADFGGKDCTIVDAARKQMELHGLLQAQVDAGKMDSDIFRTFNEDTKDFARLLTENPPEACNLLARLKAKYGV
ncbi:MAG: ankyrin repeat domain-containing protein [Oligoflexia bacterium]|nr:ankyrin repeat domain-containing protein [Oligoflexia bacterium]